MGGVVNSSRQIGLNKTVHAEWVQLQANEVVQQPKTMVAIQGRWC